VLCLYYRLVKLSSARAQGAYLWTLHITTFVTAGLLVIYVFTGLFPCSPISAYWTFPAMPGQKCLNESVLWEVSAVVNTVSEAILAILPLIAMFHFRVSPKQYWRVMSLLCLGFFITAVGCLRTFYLFQAAHTYDLTWASLPGWICSIVEVSLALVGFRRTSTTRWQNADVYIYFQVCACAVSLRPMLRRATQRLPSHKFNRWSQKLHKNSSRISNFTGSTLSSSTWPGSDAPWSRPTSSGTCIDMEGIRVDGFGYTVTISGPKSSPKCSSRFEFSKFMAANLLHTNEPRRPGSVPILATNEIEIKTSYAVQETERGV
jgi:hypothetical protein